VDKVGEACSMHSLDEKYIQNFPRIFERNILLGRWEDNIKVRLKEIRYLDVAVGETFCEPSCSMNYW
jgi:hypothetical protein